uniref:protein disulfide-isomerase n=1 Tax=Eutreptiella gymnastica TaxID=73025 RepID=A0A7S4FNS0_9EUGL
MADHTTCVECIEAGFGWCPIARKCGGFANRDCPDDDRAYAEDHPYILEKQAQAEAEAEESPVEELTDDNFDEVVLDEGKDVLVEFYAPWCGHCKELEPIWKEVAQVFQDEPDVIVAKMDATVANKVPKKYAVRSFPTIKWFPKDQKYGVEYNYERSKKGLVDFLNEKTGSARDMNGGLLPHVGRVKPLDDVVLAMEDDDAVDHAALADAIELQMGEVYKGRKEADGVKMYAGIVRAMQEESFLDKERERIESEMEEEGVDAAMRKHLQTKANVLKAFGTIRKLNVKGLRALAKEKGIDTSNVVEKADLRRAVQKSIAYGADRVPAVEKAASKAADAIAKELAEAEARAARKAEMKRKDEERKARREAEKNSAVKKLTDRTFNKTVLDESKDVLVEFYAPWCGHCKTLAPIFEEVATELKSNPDVVIAKVDATAERKVAQHYEVESFPTLIWFPKDDKEGAPYNGDRTKEALVSFIKNGGVDESENVEPEQEEGSAVVALGKSNFDQVVMDATKSVLVKFYAPWCGHCKSMIPMYEALAESFKDDAEVVVAKLDATVYKSVASQYRVTGFPTLVLFSKENKRGQRYFGERTEEGLREYIRSRGRESVDLEDLEEGAELEGVDELMFDGEDVGGVPEDDDEPQAGKYPGPEEEDDGPQIGEYSGGYYPEEGHDEL